MYSLHHGQMLPVIMSLKHTHTHTHASARTRMDQCFVIILNQRIKRDENVSEGGFGKRFIQLDEDARCIKRSTVNMWE